MPPKNTPKRKATKRHFSRRMAERFDIAINSKIRAEITAQIQNGIVVLLFRESHTKSCFMVTFHEQVFAVVYSHKYKTPITAMPLEWAQRKARLLKMEASCKSN